RLLAPRAKPDPRRRAERAAAIGPGVAASPFLLSCGDETATRRRAMPTRRFFLTALAAAAAVPARAQMSRTTAFAFHFAGLKGGDIQLAEHAGKPILIVNTASQCGYTPQYAGLQELWTRYRERGLLIVGVPSNDFGGQEPGDAAEISETAE